MNQTTYTPRLLSVDLVGTLGHLPMVGELYGNYVPLLDDEPTDGLQKSKNMPNKTICPQAVNWMCLRNRQ